jgi:intracellular sulfur oxidation DsrE/DsrF family protein
MSSEAHVMTTTILVNSNVMGDGPEEMCVKLIGSFFRKLCLEKKKPDVIVFYGSGVKLLAKGTSTVLDALEVLFESGVTLLACGTCVDYYDIRDDVFVGRITSMQDIVALLMKSEKVITVT